MATVLRHFYAATGIWLMLLTAAVPSGWAASTSPTLKSDVNIAVLAFRGTDEALRKWQPTADYLTHALHGHTFHIVPLSLADMETAVRDRQVDFVLTNPGNYVVHEALHGVTRIATLKPSTYRTAGFKFGAVIIVRKDNAAIQSIKDLKGKSFMAVGENAFGGFQMAWREMKAHGLNPFDSPGELSFVGFPQDQIVEAVLSGIVDAGTCRTGVLENLAQQGRLDMSKLRILNLKDEPGFPYALSTQLYPEWPFAQLKHTPEPLSQQVVIALLSMPADHPAALTGGYAGWTVPLDYQPVHELFKDLHIGPYGLPVEIRLSDLVEQYWQWGLFALILLGIAVMWAVWVEYLVTKRTAQLSRANMELETQIAERKRAEDVARRRQDELAHVSRVNTMGELTASLAHEINQPLSAIANYATGSVRRLDNNKMDHADLRGVLGTIASEAERAGETIRRVRELVRKGKVSLETLDLNAVIREVVEITHAEAERQNIQVQIELNGSLPPVSADKVQIEQVLLNLIGNGMEALQDTLPEHRTIVISTAHDVEGEVVCGVLDSGDGLPQDTTDILFEPFYSTKPGGMGMGLSISRSIVEASGGRMWMDTPPKQGTMFKFSLPSQDASLESEGGPDAD